MAVAGFSEQDIDIESKDNSLIVIGTKSANADDNNETKELPTPPRRFLHQVLLNATLNENFN